LGAEHIKVENMPKMALKCCSTISYMGWENQNVMVRVKHARSPKKCSLDREYGAYDVRCAQIMR